MAKEEETRMAHEKGAGRANQKTRTRLAIIAACRELIQTGAVVTIPDVARRALVSEATVYRYYPDLASLVTEAIAGLWPDPTEALKPVAASSDPVERVAFAADAFLRRALAYQGAIRSMIAATITRPEGFSARPGLRFAWIAYALAPAEASMDPATLAQLTRDLAVVLSPEALFTLTDLCGLSLDEAITHAVRLARTVTVAALSGDTLHSWSTD
jgi:AcrR family transcriptional regulator